MAMANPDGFHCSMCGECCKNLGEDRVVLVTFSDAENLAEHLGITSSEVIDRFLEVDCVGEGEDVWEIFRLKPLTNGDCVFLAEDNSCNVHAAKPHQCKHTPFGFMFEAQAFKYDCMVGVAVRPDWTSADQDAIFVKGIRQVTKRSNDDEASRSG